MLQFAAALPDPASEQVMAAALNHLGRRKGGNPPRLIAAPTVSALHRTARSHRVTAAVIRPEAIADPLQSSGSSDRIPTSLRAWLSGQPPIPTVLWASPAWLHPRRTIRLAELGLAEVVLEGEDDAPATFAEVLDRMLEHGTRRRFLEVLPPSLPRDLQELIQSLLAPRLEWPNTREMSAMLHCDRATLYRRFQRVHLPPPAQLTGWIRIYLAVELMEEGSEPGRAASDVGFASTSNMMAMVRSRMQVSSIGELLARGSDGVLEALARITSDGACRSPRKKLWLAEDATLAVDRMM